MSFNEHPQTYMARQKLKQIFRRLGYEIEEEVELDLVVNNMEEPIYPPYRADMLLSKIFIIELDSKKLHGTRKRRIHDQWRDKNIKNQMDIKTVRLIGKDVIKQSEDDILKEIDHQLKYYA